LLLPEVDARAVLDDAAFVAEGAAGAATTGGVVYVWSLATSVSVVDLGALACLRAADLLRWWAAAGRVRSPSRRARRSPDAVCVTKARFLVAE